MPGRLAEVTKSLAEVIKGIRNDNEQVKKEVITYIVEHQIYSMNKKYEDLE